VATGHAWLYFAFLKNLPVEARREYDAAAKRAQAAKMGLWGMKGEGEGGAPLNPREWRKANPRSDA